MKRIIGVTILGAALCAAPAAAQQRPQGPPEGRGRGDGAIEYLGLSEQQQEQWRALQAQHRQDMKPLHEEGRILQRRVQESLEADEPEILVGEAAKAAYAHKKRVETARNAFEAQLSSVLTAEQQEKFEALKAARGSGRKGRKQRTRRPRRESPPIDG
ncbi:MAG: periplasmic heavy metal sensor [Vicinamibacteria bacterium]